MKLKNKHFLLLLLMSSVKLVSAQSQQLTLEQAFALALKNNFDIQIAKISAEQASNNNTLGNAGMLPKLDLNATGTLSENDMHQKFSNGTNISKTGVESQNITAGAYLTWTIFDGLKMFATHSKLKELEKIGELNAKVQIENTLVKVISSYYTVAKQMQLINGLNKNLAVANERLTIAQKKFDIGNGSKFDVLQAKVDLNTIKSSLIKQNTILENAKAELNQLLMVPVEQNFEIADSIPMISALKYDDLKQSVFQSNSDLLAAEKNITINKYLLTESRSGMMPKINFNANYLFSRAESQAGFSLLNQNLGLNLGFTATWTIFNGFTNRTTTKNLKLELQNSIYEYENMKTIVQLNLLKAFRTFEDDRNILVLEEESHQFAQESLAIALERFKLGTSTSIELKLIQQSYEEAVNRLATARFNTKLSETSLLRLNGNIIK